MQNLVDRLLNSHNILSWSRPDLKNEKLVTDHCSRVKGFKTVSLLAVSLSRLRMRASSQFVSFRVRLSRDLPRTSKWRACSRTGFRLHCPPRLKLLFHVLQLVWIYEWLSSTPTLLEACIENFYSSWLLSGRSVWGLIDIMLQKRNFISESYNTNRSTKLSKTSSVILLLTVTLVVSRGLFLSKLRAYASE